VNYSAVTTISCGDARATPPAAQAATRRFCEFPVNPLWPPGEEQGNPFYGRRVPPHSGPGVSQAWRVAGRFAAGGRMALAIMSPWAVVAGALYAMGVWIVFQPMQMRGMVMH